VTETNQQSKEIRPGGNNLRVGLFGGTFNPIHLAHIKISEDVKTGFNLDKILVIPSAIPPHKKAPEIISAKDRLEMVKLCFNDMCGFEVSDIELKRKGPSYTIDTVKKLVTDNPDQTDLFLMIGSDAFFEIHTWHQFGSLLNLIGLIVMTRPGDDMENNESKEKNAGRYLSKRIDDGYQWSPIDKHFAHSLKKTISFFDVTQLSISSTKIRKYIKENNCTSSGFLHNEVTNYITKKGLYK